jgi:hypothetical protein
VASTFFFCHLKNVKPQQQGFNPYSASWIRLIMAMVYNAHQMYQNLQTFDHLMDRDNCLTFKSFTVRKAKSGSFRSFCQKAVVSMDLATLAYVDGNGDGDDSGNSDNNDEDDKK